MKLFRRSNGYWYIRFSRGKEKSLRTKDKRLAYRLFKEIQKEALKGRLISLDRQERITLADFFEEYLSWASKRKAASTLKREQSVIKNFIDYFGNTKVLNTISFKDLEAYQTFLRKKRAPAGVNLDFRHLKAAFNKAVEWGYIKRNPFSFIKPLKVPQPLPRYIKENEMEKILEFLRQRDKFFYDFVLLTLETGCRRNELLFLTAQDVDLNHGFIQVKGKGNRERIIPLTERAKAILAKRINEQGRIFKWSPDWVSQKWKKLMKKLNLPYRFHDLRHTTASWLAINGVSIKVIQELLGHSSLTVTEIYAKLTRDVIRENLEEVFGCKNSGKMQAHNFLKLIK